MPTTERQEIAEAIERSFIESLGGRASLDEVFRDLIDGLPQHLINYVVSSGLKTEIRSYFRRKNADGLSLAPEASEDGTHVQLDFLTVPEYRYVVERHLSTSAAYYSQAKKYADRCEAIHGVPISLEAGSAA